MGGTIHSLAKGTDVTKKNGFYTLSDAGTRLTKSERMPIAKAMSVAIGIPAPACVAVPKLKSKNSPAGTTIPPSAAKIGSEAFFKLESSPMYISRSSSKPMSKKKMVISPSFIQCIELCPPI